MSMWSFRTLRATTLAVVAAVATTVTVPAAAPALATSAAASGPARPAAPASAVATGSARVDQGHAGKPAADRAGLVPWPHDGGETAPHPAAPVPHRTALAPHPAAPPAQAGRRPAAPEPAQQVCPATVKVGFATCYAVRRTDVKAHKGLFAADATPSGYGPADLQSAYSLPSSADGSGETVAVVDAYDDPNAEADLQVYRSQYGLPVCDTGNGCFTKVAQDGSTNYPPVDPSGGWEEEESLDVDMVSAICPNCHILLVEADDNSVANLGTAVNEAVALGAEYVSNSYGGAEDPSELTEDTSYYDHPGVVVTASAGDNGYGVEYPAASQYVTAVGGTTLTRDPSVPRGWDESAWSATGSGCSAYEPKPSWQTDTGCADRTSVDVAADADPDTGVAVYDSYQLGGWTVLGGTSVASPIIASTYALAGAPVAGTYPSSYPYADTSALNDVTSGSDGTCTPAYLCTAGPGYDGPTGNGTPDGVAAFTTGPHGVVSGTVTDAATGKPIPGAEVTVGTQPTYADSSGDYSLSVPAGSYTVTAEEFGYQTQTVTGVQVTAGQTTDEDFALATLPSVTVSGQVTDDSGQGWPLYAKVSVPGTPAAAFTNPKTGQYSLTLPDNASYSLVVDAVSPGYQEAQQSVQVGTTNLTQDFGLQVNAQTCSAPGYAWGYQGSTETFDGDSTPPGWTVVNAPDSQRGWEFDDPQELPNNTGGSGNFAVGFAFYGIRVNEDTELVTPVTDMSQDASPYLQFNEDLWGYPGDTEDVDVSTDGGQTWTTVWQSLGAPGHHGPDLEAVPLPMAANQPDVQVRFHYVSDDGFWWALDNVFLGNRSCDPQTGGLVEGVVTDGNTGTGVNGATVTSGSTSVTTGPADPSIGDGFYESFWPVTGSQQFTASKFHYVSDSQTVTVTAGAVTEANFTLQAGQLSVTPTTVTKTTAMGKSVTQNISFTDTGQASVSVQLYQEPGGFSLASQPAAGAPLRRVSGSFSPLSAAAASRAGGAARPAATPAAQPDDPPWTTIANYPVNIMDNAVATDESTGLVYSVGGFNGSVSTAAGYVYNPGTQVWTQLPNMRYARDEPQAAFVGGKLYVTGGWGAGGNPVAALEIYDPASGSWSTGASVPIAYAGAAVAVLGGKIYLVGGCDAFTCGHTDVQVYDPATNSWSTAASYPQPIGWEACGAIGSDIYCAGGTTSATTDTADAYVYDPGSDTWSAIAPLPADLWAMGYISANGQLLVSGGVTNGFSTLTNQGYAYDPGSNSWSALPNSDNTDYRGGSACGFYRIGGSTAIGFSPQDFAEQLPGYVGCGTSSVPWLSESTDTLTLNPGASATVTVTLNAGDASVTQPGTYTAGLLVTSDTPYPDLNPDIEVTMKVTPPRTWGKVAGTVTGPDCTGSPVPLQGVTVQIDSRGARYTVFTGSDGQYGLWLDQRNSPVTVIAAQNGWQPEVSTARIRAGATTKASFRLQTDEECT